MAPGPLQIILVILLILLIFGAGRVPGIMENLAKGVQSFKKGLKEEDTRPSLMSDRAKDDQKEEE